MHRKDIERIITILKREVEKYEMPIVTKVGDSRDPFKVLISCLLSLRTKDTTTAPACKSLFKVANTPKGILRLNAKKLEKLIYPVGFYKTKAKRAKEISRILVNKYNSKVPNNMNELLKFKGIGRKCSGLVMIYGFGKAVSIPCDTHCHRLSNRIGWVKTKTPEKTEQELMKIIPRKYWYDINNTLVAFGQNTCIPIKPKCYICPVVEYCKYEYKNLNGKS